MSIPARQNWPNPSYPFWEPISFWGTVLTGSVAPTTGYVTLYNNGTAIATGTLVGSSGAYTAAPTFLAPLEGGCDTITATYSDGSDSGNFLQNPGTYQCTPYQVPTWLGLAGPENPLYGQPGAITAMLEHDATFAPYVPGGQATGSVDFYDNGVYSGSQPLDEATGQATLPTSGLAAGEHTISASYPGDYWYHDCGASTFNVDVLAPTVTTLEPDPENGDPSAYGEGLTFLTAVTAQAPATGTPTGSVDFTDTFTDPTTGTPTSTDLGTETLSCGEATFYVSTLAVGDHSIIATYLPDAASSLVFAGSASAPAAQQVNQATPTIAWVTTPTGPSNYGDPLSFVVSAGTGTRASRCPADTRVSSTAQPNSARPSCYPRARPL